MLTYPFELPHAEQHRCGEAHGGANNCRRGDNRHGGVAATSDKCAESGGETGIQNHDERSAAGIRQGVQANDVVRANADDFDHGGEW